MEEYGVRKEYVQSRDEVIQFLQDAANEAGYTCSLVWSVEPSRGDSEGYTFDYDSPGSNAVLKQYKFMGRRNGP